MKRRARRRASAAGSGSPLRRGAEAGEAGEAIDPARLPSGDEKRRVVRAMFDSIAGRYDLVNRVMTFGLDVRWRRNAVKRLGLAPGSVVADLACGTGDLCRELAKAGMRPIGFDLSMGMLQAARCSAPLVHADIAALPLPAGRLDGAVCGFALRNLVDLPAFFAETARVLRPGGRIALLDASPPEGRVLGVAHRVYFNRVVPLIGGVLSDRRAYAYLPKSMAYLPPPKQLRAELETAGFRDVEREVFSGAQLITATHR